MPATSARCGCCRGQVLPGVIWPCADPLDSGEGATNREYPWAIACDECNRFLSDEAAANALARHLTEVTGDYYYACQAFDPSYWYVGHRDDRPEDWDPVGDREGTHVNLQPLTTFDEALALALRLAGPCDCDNELVPGAHFPWDMECTPARAWVQRCDECGRFRDDAAACKAVARFLTEQTGVGHFAVFDDGDSYVSLHANGREGGDLTYEQAGELRARLMAERDGPAAPEPALALIVLEGNVVDGFQAFGPYGSTVEACQAHPDRDAWSMILEPPKVK
jgi:hypothetical protein